MVSSKELVGLGVQGKPCGERLGIKKRKRQLSKKPSSSVFVEMEASQPTGPLSGCSESAVFIFSLTLKKGKLENLQWFARRKRY